MNLRKISFELKIKYVGIMQLPGQILTNNSQVLLITFLRVNSEVNMIFLNI